MCCFLFPDNSALILAPHFNKKEKTNSSNTEVITGGWTRRPLMRVTGSDSSCNSVCLGWAANLASLPSASPRGEDTCLIQSGGEGGWVPEWLFFLKKVWGIIRRKTSHYLLWGLNEFSRFWAPQSNLVPLFMGKCMETCSQEKKKKNTHSEKEQLEPKYLHVQMAAWAPCRRTSLFWSEGKNSSLL